MEGQIFFKILRFHRIFDAPELLFRKMARRSNWTSPFFQT